MNHQLSDWDVETITDNLEMNDSGRVIAYSGRFMYGKTCLGIVTDDAPKMLLHLASGLAFAGGRAVDLLSTLSEAYVREDGMGRKTVIYFQDVALPDSFVDESDDEDDDQ